jgi:hypothetical protein
MKIDFVKTIIALGISALIAYGFYSFHKSENSNLLVLVSFIELFLCSFFILGVKFALNRTTTNIRVVSSVFFTLFLILNIGFSFFDFSQQSYIIVNGLFFLTGVLIVYSIFKAKQ